MSNPKVLIACEESQRVCTAFRERGIAAYKIKSVAKTIRDEIDVARGKEPYYYEVIISDPNGRGVIRTFPEQLDPDDPERFAAMWDRYRKMREEQNAKQ